jgi:hypothetical protein
MELVFGNNRRGRGKRKEERGKRKEGRRVRKERTESKIQTVVEYP